MGELELESEAEVESSLLASRSDSGLRYTFDFVFQPNDAKDRHAELNPIRNRFML